MEETEVAGIDSHFSVMGFVEEGKGLYHGAFSCENPKSHFIDYCNKSSCSVAYNLGYIYLSLISKGERIVVGGGWRLTCILLTY